MISILSTDTAAVLVHDNVALPCPVFRSRAEAESFLTWLPGNRDYLKEMQREVFVRVVDAFRDHRAEKIRELRHSQIGGAP